VVRTASSLARWESRHGAKNKEQGSSQVHNPSTYLDWGCHEDENIATVLFLRGLPVRGLLLMYVWHIKRHNQLQVHIFILYLKVCSFNILCLLLYLGDRDMNIF